VVIRASAKKDHVSSEKKRGTKATARRITTRREERTVPTGLGDEGLDSPEFERSPTERVCAYKRKRKAFEAHTRLAEGERKISRDKKRGKGKRVLRTDASGNTKGAYTGADLSPRGRGQARERPENKWGKELRCTLWYDLREKRAKGGGKPRAARLRMSCGRRRREKTLVPFRA